MHSGVFYVPADLATASNLEHLVTTCLRRWGTPPQARKCAVIPHDWQVRPPLSWQTARQVTRFFLTSAAAAPAHGPHSRPSFLPERAKAFYFSIVGVEQAEILGAWQELQERRQVVFATMSSIAETRGRKCSARRRTLRPSSA